MNKITIDKKALTYAFKVGVDGVFKKYKRLLKKLHVKEIKVITENWKWIDNAWMAILFHTKKQGCHDVLYCIIEINVDKFFKEIQDNFNDDELIEMVSYTENAFMNALLHELRHAAQCRYLFNRLNRNRKMMDRFMHWKNEKYKDDLDKSIIEQDADHYFQNYGYNDAIFNKLNVLDSDIEEFRNSCKSNRRK